MKGPFYGGPTKPRALPAAGFSASTSTGADWLNPVSKDPAATPWCRESGTRTRLVPRGRDTGDTRRRHRFDSVSGARLKRYVGGGVAPETCDERGDDSAAVAKRVAHTPSNISGGLRCCWLLELTQNVRQCAAVSDYLYVLELGRTRAQGNRAQFHDDEQLRAMIADWLDYALD